MWLGGVLLPDRLHGQVGGLGVGAGGDGADHLALAALGVEHSRGSGSCAVAGIHAGHSAGADDVQGAAGIGDHAGGAIVAQAADDRGDGDDALVAGLGGSTQSIIVSWNLRRIQEIMNGFREGFKTNLEGLWERWRWISGLRVVFFSVLYENIIIIFMNSLNKSLKWENSLTV